MDKQILDEYIKAIQSHYDPYYTGFAMHPEEGREAKINDELIKIQDDLVRADNALISAGQQVYNLMTNTILRLNNVHEKIMAEKERYQDMQMLCNKYNDYDNVRILTEDDFEGSYSYEGGDLSSLITKSQGVKLDVVSITGNGYEGNKYVYKDYVYSNTVLDTSVRANIVDDKITSYYEYSRITVNNTEDATISDFNKDNKEAQCTITLQAERPINEIEIKSDDSDVIVTKVSYSLDGVEFLDVNIPYITINNKLDSYENYGYIYGSGKISFPSKIQLFRITLQSNGYKNDTIAYQKALITEGLYYSDYDGYSVTGFLSGSEPVETVETYEVDEVTTVVKSAQRHVIKINEITAGEYKYNAKSRIQSVELLTQEVYSIALFANVYVPQGLADDSVKFIFTINGYDYEVVPINSHLNGIKVIRFSTGSGNNPYTERIGEKIKSAYLTVLFTNTPKASPRVNNIKILLGGEL